MENVNKTNRLKNLELIVCMDKKTKGIGFENKLLFKIKSDLRYFKKITMGHNIIMGRKTFESLPNILEGRKHFVMTTGDIDCKMITTVHSKDEMIAYVKSHPKEIFYVIGGQSIYELFKDEVGRTNIKVVDCKEDVKCDTTFDLLEYFNNANIRICKNYVDAGIILTRPLELDEEEKKLFNDVKLICHLALPTIEGVDVNGKC